MTLVKLPPFQSHLAKVARTRLLLLQSKQMKLYSIKVESITEILALSISLGLRFQEAA
jgi:hypothetical protein